MSAKTDAKRRAANTGRQQQRQETKDRKPAHSFYGGRPGGRERKAPL